MNCYFINAAHKEFLLTIGDKSCAEREGQLIIWKYEKGLQNQFMLFKERLVNALSGHLLEPLNQEVGSIVIQDGVYKREEKWAYYPDMTIRNSKGLVLDVQGGRFEEGTPIILWNSNGTEQQKWIPCTVLVTGRKHKKHHSKKEKKPEPAPEPAEEKKESSSDDEKKKKGFFEKVADKISDALSSSSSSDDEKKDAPEGEKKHRKRRHHTKDGSKYRHRKHHSHSKEGEK
ncbi:QXW lectin repeat family protein [Trichomonas vaginalis G3]|uniref:QXW lectin repeat family protein n=1 Tax=Trichomonas vaginalis (strain ATCC PRA-98 / G3) TaxID=412133 RepID=A2E0R7_TRIV3|nr:beta/gamma crystallin family [Trichomonas vaginalis G3]EAY13812.1 QXW lectin repeat family protein [Trichomonas vaginalis G3]KAI5542674.1 beta/gamma crystallin family [Trichomonas vaginalis G3]|eukprot:XP_001326035.1 QXW lectin repeat family protein [Trichomonas vaginalis G3]